ncbi:MAG: polymer-forming cytoskeletal protein [Halioglobus sp.]|nr:polymer-forming cytoskeletal protein [Halioglobus sp.]
MLGSKKSAFSVSGTTTLVSRDTVVVGDIHFSGNLDVEGLVQGSIIAQPDKDAMVRVVDKGRVEGEIRAPSVIVNGTVQGDVHAARRLELAAKGRVQGNVFYTQIEMAAGAEVNGSLTHVGEAGQAKNQPPAPALEGTGAGGDPKTAMAAPSKLD